MRPMNYIKDGLCLFTHDSVDEAAACAERGDHIPYTDDADVPFLQGDAAYDLMGGAASDYEWYGDDGW